MHKQEQTVVHRDTRISHDAFIYITEMTPDEYRDGGKNLTIRYSFEESPFGAVMIASTHKGLIQLSFIDGRIDSLSGLRARFPDAYFEPTHNHKQVLQLFTDGWQSLDTLYVHLKGTAFQLQVWQALLTIPVGARLSYNAIAKMINKPQANRAVGSAIGANPIALLIPCHRVIRSDGTLGNYYWGSVRKAAILDWESRLIHASD